MAQYAKPQRGDKGFVQKNEPGLVGAIVMSQEKKHGIEESWRRCTTLDQYTGMSCEGWGKGQTPNQTKKKGNKHIRNPLNMVP